MAGGQYYILRYNRRIGTKNPTQKYTIDIGRKSKAPNQCARKFHRFHLHNISDRSTPNALGIGITLCVQPSGPQSGLADGLAQISTVFQWHDSG